jgi:four helix bundle protein
MATWQKAQGPLQSYRELRVWGEGMKLAEQRYHLTKGFPKEEMYSLTSQIRRAAASVPANIAEGYGRENRGDYVQFLRIAQGSLKELETHLILSEKVHLAPGSAIDPVLAQCETTGRMPRSLIRSLHPRFGPAKSRSL